MDQACFFHTFCQMNLRHVILDWAFCVVQLVKNPPAMQETWVQSLGWEDPLEKGKGYPLQYCGLENSMDCVVHGVAKSGTQLSDFHFQDKDEKSQRNTSHTGECSTIILQ